MTTPLISITLPTFVLGGACVAKSTLLGVDVRASAASLPERRSDSRGN
jgi:hypothetical protein